LVRSRFSLAFWLVSIPIVVIAPGFGLGLMEMFIISTVLFRMCVAKNNFDFVIAPAAGAAAESIDNRKS